MNKNEKRDGRGMDISSPLVTTDSLLAVHTLHDYQVHHPPDDELDGEVVSTSLTLRN